MSLFRLIILNLALFLFEISFAKNIRIDIEPRIPRVNSPYVITFRIISDGGEDQAIDFKPVGMELMGQHSKGISMKTRFVSGKLFTEKEITYSYEFISPKDGNAWLRNIKVKSKSSTLTHPDIKIRISKEIDQLKNFFVEADISKKSVFVGEGVTVKYYIYTKGNVKNYELRTYPKLKKFLKRFINRPERSGNVEVGGEVFRRDLLYSARVFPEKPGKYYIDPIEVRVEYSKPTTNNPFSFNFSFHRLMARNIRSRQIEVRVKPLPPAPDMANFTGLVGKHLFKLVQPKNRYIVNEAIEINLEVTGGGALEAYKAPDIYIHPKLEEFEMSGDLQILDMDNATKVYKYTYLAREPLEIKEDRIELTYFDPNEETYKNITLGIPGLIARGGAVDLSLPSDDKKQMPNEVESTSLDKKSSDVVAPVFLNNFLNREEIVQIINSLMSIILVLLMGSFFLYRRKKEDSLEKAKNIVKSIRGGTASYSDIFHLFHIVQGESGDSLEDFVKKKRFSVKTKEYLLHLVKSAEEASYLKGEKIFSFKYDKKSFNELLNFISIKSDLKE